MVNVADKMTEARLCKEIKDFIKYLVDAGLEIQNNDCEFVSVTESEARINYHLWRKHKLVLAWNGHLIFRKGE